MNINGDLIGINTAIYAKAQGIGFAIPIGKAQKIISDLIQYGEVIQAWIGITVQAIDEKLARYLKVPAKKGVIVTSVEPESPAQKAGVQESDIILSIASKKITSVGLPILPITIIGTRDIQRPKSMMIVPGKARMVIHPAIEVKGEGPKDIRELLTQTREVIASALPDELK